MIGVFLSAISIISVLTFFGSLAALFALNMIGKYENQRRYDHKVELIRRLSVSSKRARRSSKARSVMLNRRPSMKPPTPKSKSSPKVRDVSRRAKFRRAFKLSIVIPDDGESDNDTILDFNGNKTNITKIPSPIPKWSPSSLEVAVQKVVKKNFDDIFVKIGSPTNRSLPKNKKTWPGSPTYRPQGPDGKKWQFFDDTAYDDIFGKNERKLLKDSLFYSHEETLGTWMVETFSMQSPYGIKYTTNSFTIGWDSMVNKDKASVIEYDLQCRVAKLDNGDLSDSPRNAEFFVDIDGNKNNRVYHDCLEIFTSLPKDAFRKNFNKLKIQGLTGSSPPIEYRVRLKSFAGWGPYTKPSEPFRPLASTTFAPETRAITSRGVEIRWHPLKDVRYGRTIRYTLTGKKAGQNRFSTIFIGKGTSCIVQAIQNKALKPNTTYVFQLLIRTDAGDVLSQVLPITTLAAPPDPPAQPTVGIITSGSVELSWTRPCDNGAQIEKYVLYGRRSRSNRFKRLFTGNALTYHVGGTEGQGQLAPDTVYIFKVKACNAHGDGATSSTVSVTTLSLTASPIRREGSGDGQTSPIASSPVPIGRRRSSTTDNRRGSFISPNSPAFRNPDRRNSSTSPTNTSMSVTPARVSELPNGWVECWDPERENCYYYNSVTGITQWMHPTKGDHKDPELPFRKKRFKLLYSLRERDWPKGGRKIIKITLRRSHLVQDSFTTLERLGVEKLKLKTKIVFENEEGIDSGGLTKDWFLELSRGLFNPLFCLLKKHEARVYHIDPRSGVNEEHLRYFHFFGNFLAKAIYDRQLVDVQFCRVIYKHLLGLPPTIDDLGDIDSVYFTSLKWILNNDIDDIIYETFSVTIDNFGEKKIIDLIPNGSKIEVTNKNKEQYVSAIVKWTMCDAMKEQIEHLKKGFYEIVPLKEIKDFTPTELSLLLNGKKDINVDEMANQTKYTGGYSRSSVPVQFFWVAMKSFSKEERGELLQYATGTNKAPLDGFDPAFTITLAEGADVENALPTAHTCFNQLVLPEYKSVETLMQKLRYAFKNSSGFQLT